MSLIECTDEDFGVIDFNLKRMTFEGQDVLRLLISSIGEFKPAEVKLDSSIRGLCKALNEFEDFCDGTNDTHGQLLKSIESAAQEIEAISTEHSVSYVTGLTSQTHVKEIRKWKLIEACDDLNSINLLKYVGAFFSLLLTNRKVAAQTEDILWRLIKYGEESLVNSSQKALARMLYRGQQIFTGESKSFVARVRSHYFFQKNYSSKKDRQSITDWRSMTRAEYLATTAELYERVRSGCVEGLVDSLSLIIGLQPDLVLDAPILSHHSDDDWVIVLDITNGTVLFDLSEIFPNGAKPTDGAGDTHYEKSSTVLVKPLPQFISKVLQELHENIPDALDIKSLLCLENKKTKTSNKIARLIKTTAIIATRYCKIDPYDACVLSGDFRGVASAKAYYRRTTRQASWSAANSFYAAIGWGECVEKVEGLAFGSRVVAKDEVISSIFIDLSNQVNQIRPSNRCGVKKLLEFHNAFCNYTATFAIFCLALRDANPISLLSRDFHEFRSYIIVDDKNVLDEASALPVAITPPLSEQLTYWRIHCAKLVARLQEANFRDKKFINYLKGVVEYNESPLFVMSDPPYPVSVSRIAKSWTNPLVENFARHFWESKFLLVGVSSRFSAAHLRHQVSGVMSWASDSDFVLREFIRVISAAQDEILQELNISPVHGLARK